MIKSDYDAQLDRDQEKFRANLFANNPELWKALYGPGAEERQADAEVRAVEDRVQYTVPESRDQLSAMAKQFGLELPKD